MSIQCPKGELLWQTICDGKNSARFLVTSKPARDFYFLYRVEQDGSLTKLGKDKTPPSLLEKYHVKEERRDGK